MVIAELHICIYRPVWIIPGMWLAVTALRIGTWFGRPVTEADISNIGAWFSQRLMGPKVTIR
jgi:hypothetical protein